MIDFPDYEAAARMIHQCRNLGTPPKRLPDIEAARLIVNAALGDKALYRMEYSKETQDDEYTVRTVEKFVQVWSKEET